ncbi:MAG: cation:proton antiporter [Hydrogenophaga sp.]|uniref:monovalent cation:proton antiporter-2 (CPA2) family protein n=1 Tax=Hydrogenophaga sp. TaxID=1904254 RepID=UPI0025BA9F3B|nr:monovalent cation:proton antiporter-2 (CPA2) family protein [Hydrogenophaga sp.]MBT9552752.1 cation:proton antiporter [Hydrogenophaga sp.]
MTQAILFLLAALVFVPLAVRAGLGSVLGYLVAGVVIGPVGLGVVNDPTAILHVSELGVVLMLFVIGLELEPQRLWAMRGAVFGGGALQMLLCAALLFPVGLLVGWTWQAALVGSLAMALSSTAIAVAILQERNLMSRPVGQSGFAMLLFQDIAAIPLLALAAVLGSAAPAAEPTHGAHSGGVWLQIAAVVGVVVFGRFVAYPLMRYIARIDVRELFTGFALLLVLGVAALMEYVGLSMGLGAFLAGVLLASSEYRHALENDILPFKGLLLGLFFIAVGMSMQLGLLLSAPVQVIVGLVVIVALKALGLWLLGRVVKLAGSQRSLLAVLLSQVGEFAFVVLAAAKASTVLPAADADLLTLIAALSMVSTPLLLIAFDRYSRPEASSRLADTIDEPEAPVLLAGFGRYGQIVARTLLSAGIRPTVIDHDADTVDSARRFGYKVYFGDATQPDLLHAAGVAQARAVVIAIDDAEQVTRLVHELQTAHPGLPIVARAYDSVHAQHLADAKVHHVQRELLESSLRSARATLELLGFDRFHARQLADDFRRHSESMVKATRTIRHEGDGDDYVKRLREAREEFERQMQADLQRQRQHAPARGWGQPD